MLTPSEDGSTVAQSTEDCGCYTSAATQEPCTCSSTADPTDPAPGSALACRQQSPEPQLCLRIA